MTLNKHIERNIQHSVFLIELSLDIKNYKDSLIKDIEIGIHNSNFNFKTNVKGYMTDWKYFNDNKIFLEILGKAFEEIESYMRLKNVYLAESWGIKLIKGNNTELHNHNTREYAGILYLNECDNLLNFPELNMKIKPKEGTFLLFTSTLMHEAAVNKIDISKYAIPFNFAENKAW